MLDNFVKVGDIPQDVIKKYKNQVPEELIRVWQEDGLGTFLDGYLKVINPDDYDDLLKESYFAGEASLPIFVTAFGDIVVWEDNRYVGLVKYNIQDIEIVCSGLDLFFMYLTHHYITDKFDLELYHQAVAKHGALAYDQCFGFVPLLAMGGTKDVDHMDKVKMFEHIYLMYQLTGGVFDD